MVQTPVTLDDLFIEAVLENDSVDNMVVDDFEDEVLDHLEENRQISIFDSEFLLEGEM